MMRSLPGSYRIVEIAAAVAVAVVVVVVVVVAAVAIDSVIGFVLDAVVVVAVAVG